MTKKEKDAREFAFLQLSVQGKILRANWRKQDEANAPYGEETGALRAEATDVIYAEADHARALVKKADKAEAARIEALNALNAAEPAQADEARKLYAAAEATARKAAAESMPNCPVLSREQLALLQAEWRRSPGLRCCIRLVADIDDYRVTEASRLLRALWLMSASWEWRREAGGMLPFEWPPMD